MSPLASASKPPAVRRGGVARSDTFIGVAALRSELLQQRAVFERAFAARNFNKIHDAHYDWWAFPINEVSGRGRSYCVDQPAVAALRADAEFMQALRRNGEIMLEAWGWDWRAGAPMRDADAARGQRWHDWPVRLYKLGRAMQLFGIDDVFAGAHALAVHLQRNGASLTYHSSSARKHCDVLEMWAQPLWQHDAAPPTQAQTHAHAQASSS